MLIDSRHGLDLVPAVAGMLLPISDNRGDQIYKKYRHFGGLSPKGAKEMEQRQIFLYQASNLDHSRYTRS